MLLFITKFIYSDKILTILESAFFRGGYDILVHGNAITAGANPLLGWIINGPNYPIAFRVP